MVHPKWEYLVEGIPAPSGQAIGIVRSNASTYVDPVQSYLNDRGEEGWELVEWASRDDTKPRSIYAPGMVFVFKRLKL